MKKHLFYVLTICICSTAAFGAGRSLPDTAKIIPPETMVLINIADVNTLQKQFQKTDLYKLYKDPAMAPFFNAFKAKWQRALRNSPDRLGKIIADVNTLPSGRLAGALLLTENSKTTGELAFLVISQWGKDVPIVKKAVDKAVKNAIESGARQEKETIRGRDVVTITEKTPAPAKSADRKLKSDSPAMKPAPQRFIGIAGGEENERGDNIPQPDEEGAAQAPPPAPTAPASSTISYCFLDDVLIVAEDRENLKFVLSRIEGGSGSSLADNADYQTAMAAVGPLHDVDLYVKEGTSLLQQVPEYVIVEQIIRSLIPPDKADEIGEQIDNLSLANVSCLGASLSLGRTNSAQAAIRGLLKINGPKKGVMKMLEPQNAPLRLPRFIDASSVSISVSNISLKNAYDELINIMAAISPGSRALIETPMVPGDESGKGKVELKKDIIDYLGPQIIVASSLKKPFVAGLDPARIVAAIAVTDSAAIEKSLATLHAAMSEGKPDSKREILGHTIYLMEMGNFPLMMRGPRPMADVAERTPRPESPKLAFTVTDTHLILGSEDGVAQAIRLLSDRDAALLTAAPWFVRAKSALPGAVGITELSDNRNYGEYMWWILKEKAKHRLGSAAPDTAQISLSDIMGFCDFSLLPEFEPIKKYLGVAADYIVSRPDGYYFEIRQLDLAGQ